MEKHWYILQVHSGFEDKVKATLEERIKNEGLVESFGDILIPTEQVVEMVKGVRKTSSRKFFPGYILISMELNDTTWHCIHENMPRVVGFVGDDTNPLPLPDEEAAKIIGRIHDGSESPRPKVIFEVGEVVRVTDGPFANFQGVVDEVFPEKGRVRVKVSIFGRETPVELEYVQVSNS
ncbi:MAG: transcription termination/antitermination protein NusG [Proteobacteria bacterium]|jgi:transcriptional antiterminator NusG|nr:transcription termination/antitermination protein NusG [Desulfocapsa sp.]MBU3943628.1 transcription termination/antitermination protein NusG [Pseudomonadota bacterium]MCG2744601.1 transcription termination/antitermination protein NusG [Desulfobacteraceae bacterium]MDO8948470.1 transcription termination/antitermination protein NusG [Desulfocapsaceae bacterium]MBU3983757.1 transcription termination/antitermination protein NusG [Pseudomonadota bacterium]